MRFHVPRAIASHPPVQYVVIASNMPGTLVSRPHFSRSVKSSMGTRLNMPGTGTVIASLTTVRNPRNEARRVFVRQMGVKTCKDETARMVAS